MHNRENSKLGSIIIKWYKSHKRDLPWRDTTDAYTIWLSEVILQQTRVNQGYGYFVRFMERFPDIKTLASASEDEVLKLWQGLGYYSRARNLHAAAKAVVEKYNGEFPKEYKDVLSLKGVGEYTAAAIVSFAYDQPYPVVDGNVYRVLARIFAVDEPIDTGRGKKAFNELASLLLDKDAPGLYNQAIMEFGALQCVPVSPDCNRCPANNICMAYNTGKVSSYPVKLGKQKVRHRYFNYFDIRYKHYTYLNKRENKDIWENLYEYPLIETPEYMPIEELRNTKEFDSLFSKAGKILIKPVMEKKHVLSHQVIHASFYKVEVEEDNFPGIIKIGNETLDNYPVSRLMHLYIEKI